ncbi:MAG TPA: xanthine phosphoribosyltransferase [Spirochaetota bacterium]|nr:xanthine phosphoribosyltransferase [Spirochaetota bacterium]HPF06851.1 xanthine phosphoribosyltransferase [Spirochaetota bacterium]HPJ42182.1 xanthine phosphoribosyltransferase [Spirochaetota bacterium]HRX48043.1 xanthine phosphoribosyltransferase [Spirochaetota bacterium]
MKLLKKRITEEGRALSESILKVDSFLNHQIEPALIDLIAGEFCRRFADRTFNKILTVESSGIAPAVLTGLKMNLPVVFAKKAKPSTMNEEYFTAPVHSFTKQKDYDIAVSSKFIRKGERVLIIDDFLAHGSASRALIAIAEQGGAKVDGIGIVIEKGFQNGGKLLRELGYRIESLAIIEEMSENMIRFRN